MSKDHTKKPPPLGRPLDRAMPSPQHRMGYALSTCDHPSILIGIEDPRAAGAIYGTCQRCGAQVEIRQDSPLRREELKG